MEAQRKVYLPPDIPLDPNGTSTTGGVTDSNDDSGAMTMAVKLYITVGALAGACLLLGVIYVLLMYFHKGTDQTNNPSRSPSMRRKSIIAKNASNKDSTHLYLKFYSMGLAARDNNQN